MLFCGGCGSDKEAFVFPPNSDKTLRLLRRPEVPEMPVDNLLKGTSVSGGERREGAAAAARHVVD